VKLKISFCFMLQLFSCSLLPGIAAPTVGSRVTTSHTAMPWLQSRQVSDVVISCYWQLLLSRSQLLYFHNINILAFGKPRHRITKASKL
jgi:hypothetical protein